MGGISASESIVMSRRSSSEGLMIFVDWYNVTYNAVRLQSIVIHFSDFIAPSSNSGDAVLVGLHHGLVGSPLGHAGHLNQGSSNVLSRVETVVVNPNFPGFSSRALSFLDWLLNALFVLRLWTFQSSGSPNLDCLSLQSARHHDDRIPSPPYGRGRRGLTRSRTQRRHKGCGGAKETGQKEDYIQCASHDEVKDVVRMRERESCSSTLSNESLCLLLLAWAGGIYNNTNARL